MSAYLFDRDAAIDSLRRCVAAKESPRFLLGVNCALEWLKDDEEFNALLRSMGLAGWCGARR